MTFSVAGIFVAGLLTFVTPCVLPLIPIYLSALIGGDIRQLSEGGVGARGQLIMRAVLFSIGFIAVFTLMGLTASALGNVLSQYKTAVEVTGALLILVFGLKFLGVIRIPFFDRIVRADDQKLSTRFGGINALIMGVVFAAGWSPCVGPVLGSILTYTASTTSDPATGALYLTIYGVGFAIPLLLTAAFAEAGVKFLRKINPYLPKIERAIGAFLIVIALSLVYDIAMTHDFTTPESERTNVADLTYDEQGERWPLMIELYSRDCPVCEGMKPIVDGIANQCHGQMVRVKMLDVSKPENKHLIEKFRLVGVPTFIFLDDKANEVARLVGEQREDALKQALSALRGQPCPGLTTIPGLDAEGYTPIFPDQQDDNTACGAGEEKGNEAGEEATSCEDPAHHHEAEMKM